MIKSNPINAPSMGTKVSTLEAGQTTIGDATEALLPYGGGGGGGGGGCSKDCT